MVVNKTYASTVFPFLGFICSRRFKYCSKSRLEAWEVACLPSGIRKQACLPAGLGLRDSLLWGVGFHFCS